MRPAAPPAAVAVFPFPLLPPVCAHVCPGKCECTKFNVAPHESFTHPTRLKLAFTPLAMSVLKFLVAALLVSAVAATVTGVLYLLLSTRPRPPRAPRSPSVPDGDNCGHMWPC